jgi:hypothetical protein
MLWRSNTESAVWPATFIGSRSVGQSMGDHKEAMSRFLPGDLFRKL